MHLNLTNEQKTVVKGIWLRFFSALWILYLVMNIMWWESFAKDWTHLVMLIIVFFSLFERYKKSFSKPKGIKE